jgi:predicted RNA-binding Zn ribbon-like protein
MLLALSLANERLGSSQDLRRWLELVGTDPAMSEEVSLRLPEFVALGSSVREMLEASIDGEPFPAAAVARLNELSERVPRVLRFEPPTQVDVPQSGSTTSLMLARIAWSAFELIGGEDGERLRSCSACGRFFVASRSDRRWCSSACGNRTRVARYQARRRATG